MIASRLRRALAAAIGNIAAVLRNVWRLRWRILGIAVLLARRGRGRISITTITATSPKSISTTRSGNSNTARPAATGSPAFRPGSSRRCRNLCRDYLPGEGWQSLGFVFEPGMDRPAGTSKRRTLGFDRIALNCAACHVGTYRETPQSTPVVVAGMPANHIDLGRFTQFLTDLRARRALQSVAGRAGRRAHRRTLFAASTGCCCNTSPCRRCAKR